MTLEITEKKQNSLLQRIEVKGKVNYGGKATPSNTSIREELAKQLNVDKELIIVNHIYTQRGTREGNVYAYVYANKEARDKYTITTKHMKKQKEVKEKEEKKEKEEAKRAEGITKTEETPAEEPKAEEKPTGELAEEPKAKEKPAGEPAEEPKAEEKPAGEPAEEPKAEEKPAEEKPETHLEQPKAE